MNKVAIPIVVVLVFLIVPSIVSAIDCSCERVWSSISGDIYTLRCSVYQTNSQEDCSAGKTLCEYTDNNPLFNSVTNWYVKSFYTTGECRITNSYGMTINFECDLSQEVKDKCGASSGYTRGGSVTIEGDLDYDGCYTYKKYYAIGEKWCSYGDVRECIGNKDVKKTDCGDLTCRDGECIEQPQPYCGDGSCDIDENWITCLEDCPFIDTCGNGICGDSENYLNCPQDCEEPPPTHFCGDANCDEDENWINCPQDCVYTDVCGDDKCGKTETWETCPDDCDEPPECVTKDDCYCITLDGGTCECINNECVWTPIEEPLGGLFEWLVGIWNTIVAWFSSILGLNIGG